MMRREFVFDPLALTLLSIIVRRRGYKISSYWSPTPRRPTEADLAAGIMRFAGDDPAQWGHRYVEAVAQASRDGQDGDWLGAAEWLCTAACLARTRSTMLGWPSAPQSEEYREAARHHVAEATRLIDRAKPILYGEASIAAAIGRDRF